MSYVGEEVCEVGERVPEGAEGAVPQLETCDVLVGAVDSGRARNGEFWAVLALYQVMMTCVTDVLFACCKKMI